MVLCVAQVVVEASVHYQQVQSSAPAAASSSFIIWLSQMKHFTLDKLLLRIHWGRPDVPMY